MGGPVGHTIDLTSEFLLGTKIAHVWEENESLFISICGIQVPERGSYKKALFVGHPVRLIFEWILFVCKTSFSNYCICGKNNKSFHNQ